MAGFAVGIVIVLAAGTAYACVPFKGNGQVEVSDPSPGGGAPQNSGTHTGRNGTNLQYCDSGTTFPGWTNDAEAQADGGDVITVSVFEKAGTCAGKLDDGTYSVIVNNATVASASPFTFTGGVWSMVATTGCFTSATPNGNITLDTAFMVDANGDGTKTYTLPSMNRVDGTLAASSLCVGSPSTGLDQGIFVPIIIEATI